LPVAGAAITACNEPASGTITQCSPLAVIYSDSALQNQLASLATGINGCFQFYAPPNLYRIQINEGGSFTTFQNVSLGNVSNPFGNLIISTVSGAFTIN